MSLAKKRTIILNYVLGVVGTNSDKSNFAFPDSNRNLKIRITELLNRKSFFSFKDRDKLHTLIPELSWNPPKVGNL